MENKDDITLENKHVKFLGKEFFSLTILGIIFALAGWIIENIAHLLAYGIVDSRFHLLPFISPYALIPFAFAVFNSPDDIAFFNHHLFKQQNRKTKIYSNLIVIAACFIAVFLGELAVGNLWDYLFGVQLWDYSKQPLHVTQYTGVFTSLGLALGAWFVFKFIYNPLIKLVEKIPYIVRKIITLTLGVLIVLDTLAMMLQIIIVHEAKMWWSIKIWEGFVTYL